VRKSLLGSVVLGVFVLVSSTAFAAPAEQEAATQEIVTQEAATQGVAPQGAAPQPEKNPERVLAKIDNHEIKEKDVDQVIQMAGPQGAGYDNEQGRKVILDRLVATRLFALSGAKQGLDKTPEFESTLESFATQALASAAIEKSTRDIVASEEESKKFYDENPDQFTTPESIHARHILVSDDVTSSDRVKSIQAELKKGVSFDVLAVQHSIDPSAVQGGGDLGFFSRGEMVPEFEKAAFALKEPGDISEPVKSAFGWHIIKLEEKQPSSVLGYDEIKPQIVQYLSNEKRAQRYREELEALKKEYKVELFEAEKAPQ
jgi:peptidyl-prolyl cis-trans isomerase C